jgi:hypothetical protein
MDTSERSAGGQRIPQTDVALVETVLDLVSAGATLSGVSLVTIAKHAGVSPNSIYQSPSRLRSWRGSSAGTHRLASMRPERSRRYGEIAPAKQRQAK